MDKQNNNYSSSDVIDKIDKAKSVKYRRSVLAQEVLSEKNNFINKWALISIVAVILLSFAATSLVPYPAYIMVNSEISAINSPLPIKVIGNDCFHLLAKNKSMVKKGEILAVAKGKGDLTEILKLKTILIQKLITDNLPSAKDTEFDHFRHLGELQNLFNSQIKGNKADIKRFLNDIHLWLTAYTVQAPADGYVTWNVVDLGENAQFTNNAVIAYVTPNTEYYVKISLSEANLGKIQVGQKVRLRLNAFLSDNIDIIDGKISNVADILNNGRFIAYVTIPDSITRISNKNSLLKDRLGCNAYIIIKDQTLFDAIFSSMFNGLKHS